ncbi:hypothetical protein BVRB_8g197010 [Beta vulgaris subsp. vulgaris]|nr:hypothetical protein BVRB_8g197010 [Beta vulgaris subsp. vulgaris]
MKSQHPAKKASYLWRNLDFWDTFNLENEIVSCRSKSNDKSGLFT